MVAKWNDNTDTNITSLISVGFGHNPRQFRRPQFDNQTNTDRGREQMEETAAGCDHVW